MEGAAEEAEGLGERIRKCLVLEGAIRGAKSESCGLLGIGFGFFFL